MTNPVFQFVAAPSVGAAVRFDMARPGQVYVREEGFTIGRPSFSGGPRSTGVDYGYRDLNLEVTIAGTEAFALTVLQALARELLRPTNWLLFQVSPTAKPVWFKIYAQEPGDLSFAAAGVGRWRITVPLTAEGFAFGAREVMAAAVINNDPAAGSNPCYTVLPVVLGDAPTYARVQANPSNTNYMNGYRWMLATSTFDPAYAPLATYAPVVWQIGGSDGWTAGTGTAASSADANSSGGSSRVVSFGTPALTTRISGTTPTNVYPGGYKVLVRCIRSDLDSTFSLRFGVQTVSQMNYGDTVFMKREPSLVAGHATWVDLGDFVLPPGTEGVPDDQVGFVSTINIALQAGRISGTGSLRLDAIKLIPLNLVGQVDSRLLYAEFPAAGIFIDGGLGIWDGDEEGFWGRTQFGTLAPVVPELAGGFPLLHPDKTNHLHVLQQVNGRRSVFGDDASDLISVSTEVVVSYHPRYLYLAA